ncbi:Glu-tRNA(Gln) amidotransferase subunit GatD [Candidatus Woesearchaeota archaeon]|nr:Glu-tRNA(Gln) amidotransferase subunit GatD [Candidatus Woesearchaeota archaeon]
MSLKQGDAISVKTDSLLHEGVFVKEDNKFIFLKLKSGYNIGVNKQSISEIKTLAEKKDKEASVKVAKPDKKLPLVSLLHTGGTIASKVDYSTGAVVAKFTPEEIIQTFPELLELANIKSQLISNIMSENMRFHHYNLIARAVEKEIKAGAQGVIVTHGTDTLHYTAAALSFMLKNVPVPVMLIGSQRSSDRPSTDSAVNLLSAVTFITHAGMKGVFICMHENLDDETCLVIEGVNARKMHSSRRDAFRPINKTPIAKVDYKKKQVKIMREVPQPEDEFKVKLFDEKIKVGIVKMHPQMYASELAGYEQFNGLIIEGTGLGHASIIKGDDESEENDLIKSEIRRLAGKMPIVMTTQTIYGRVNMNVYSPGRDLLEIGLLGNYCDMTPETAFIKLAWLLSTNSGQKASELFGKNLRGELSERSEKETFLI